MMSRSRRRGSILLGVALVALLVVSTGGVAVQSSTSLAPLSPGLPPPKICDPPQPAVRPLATPIVQAAVAFDPSDAGIDLDFCSTISGVTGVYTLNWSFGDGTFSALRDPVHVYETPANYTVVLKLNSTDYNTTSTIYALVNASVVASASYSPLAPTTASKVNFTDSASLGVPPYSITWNFGGGSTAAGASVVHNFGAAGAYTVQVWTNDSGGGSLLKTIQVTVTKVPGPGFSLGGGTGILVGTTIAAVAVAIAGFGYLQYEKRRRPKLPAPAPAPPK
jgi:hypothetical protein